MTVLTKKLFFCKKVKLLKRRKERREKERKKVRKKDRKKERKKKSKISKRKEMGG